MFERSGKITKYHWTARRFEIVAGNADFRNIILEFIYPIVHLIRHGEEGIAERWYWSWWKEIDTNFHFRLYFLAKKSDHDNLWKIAEGIRSDKFDNSINRGTSENVWEDLSDEVLEWGITLEHASEMSLMVWRGLFPGTDDLYGKTFHHFFQPLLITDGHALKVLMNSIGDN